jgi:hypothetical protein
MQKPANIYQGDRSEPLAQYLISSLAIATPVPRQQDFQGIDFHCSLLREVRGNLQPFAPFNVQIKSSSENWVEYGGLTGTKDSKTRHWRSHEIEALSTYQTPFFIGVVDKKEARLDLYQTMTRFFLSGKRMPYLVRLCVNTPTGDNHLSDGEKIPEEAAKAYDCTPEIWNIPLGQPVISISASDVASSEKLNNLAEVLLEHISLDQENITFHRAGLLHFRWPLTIRTGQKLTGYGISLAPGDPNKLKRVITPAIAALLSTYKDEKRRDLIKAWEAAVPQLSREDYLGWIGKIIDEKIAFGNEQDPPEKA